MKLTNEEQLNEINTRFSNRFQELLKKCEGRICGGAIVSEYLRARDLELAFCPEYIPEKAYEFLKKQRFNTRFYEVLFDYLEERIEERLKEI